MKLLAPILFLFLAGCQFDPATLLSKAPTTAEVCEMQEPERSTMIKRLNTTAEDLALACIFLNK